ncbi:MAG: hypothetical protein K2O11_01175 [Oscillospiraceae bacterium]|nr:hypothetical protein [Oscillospiraceae bacterium]
MTMIVHEHIVDLSRRYAVTAGAVDSDRDVAGAAHQLVLEKLRSYVIVIPAKGLFSKSGIHPNIEQAPPSASHFLIFLTTTATTPATAATAITAIALGFINARIIKTISKGVVFIISPFHKNGIQQE